MERVAFVVLALGAVLFVVNPELAGFERLDGKLWLVAIFPAVYLLGLVMLRD